MILHEYRLPSGDFCIISFHIHLTHRVQHTVLSCSYRKTSFAFPKGLVKPLNLESLPLRKTKNFKTSSHHITLRALMEEFRRSPAPNACVSLTVLPLHCQQCPQPGTGVLQRAQTLTCSALPTQSSIPGQLKISFQECSGKWKVRSEHVEAALRQAKYNKQVLDPVCSQGTPSL